MFTSVSKGLIWPMTIIVLGCLASVTFLADKNVVSGATAGVVITLVLAAVGVGGASHIGGATATNAVNGALHSALTPAPPSAQVPIAVLTTTPEAAKLAATPSTDQPAGA